MEKRIGIMGGTFDPVHMGHLIIAETARVHLQLDKIIFLPTGRPPHKKNKISDPIHRFNMIQLSIEGNNDFECSDTEILRTGITYTIDTLQTFNSETFPGAQLFFILGADAMDDIDTWKGYKELFQYATFVVVTRGTNAKYELKPAHEPFKQKIIVLDTPFIEISSTEIRDKVQNNISIRYIVDRKVDQYISENKLYKENLWN